MGVGKTFHIYKSSAGSGKTYTLVKEYLKLVLQQPANMRHILAITFTNAAAAEMKSRIIRELGNISKMKEPSPEAEKTRSLVSQILEEWKDEGIPLLSQEQLTLNAGTVLKRILHNYADFSVSTIDSFVSRVIRSFAFDLGIPLNFDVELDAESLLRQATDLLISRAGQEEKLTRVLLSFIISQTDEEKDLNIENQITGLAKTLMDEDGAVSIEKLKEVSLDDFLEIAGQLKSRIRAFEENSAKEAAAALERISEKQLSPSAFFQGEKGIYGYFKSLAEGRISEKIVAGKNVRKTLEEDKWFGGKASADEKASIEAIKPDLMRAYQNITGPEEKNIEQYKIFQALSKNIFPVAVLNEVEKILEEIKEDEVLLHISDFNKKIAAIVAEQPVPFIYERLGERYRHYMIDEFQDTSTLQWQNLLPLVDNGLASGNLSLVVGDGKQAIYRWRNGDVEQFASLPYLSPSLKASAKAEWEQSLINHHENKNLNRNFRSRINIVDFNNRFFEYARESLAPGMQNIYHEVRQTPLENKTGGYVEIDFPEENGDKTHYEQTLEKIFETLEKLLQAGHPLSDITILCRSNKDASGVARDLTERSVPVISSESLLLNQSDEVNFFIAIIKLLANGRDKVAATEMLGYLYKSKRISQPPSLHEGIKHAGLFAPAKKEQPPSFYRPIQNILEENGISLNFGAFFHQNLYDTCETILRIFFSGDKTPNPFVAFFMDAVFDYSEKHSLSLTDFLEWWEEKSEKFSLVVSEGINAVQVKTIHKAKGLQFPVVIFPFASQDTARKTKKGQWVEPRPELLPELPVTWVSFSKKSLENTPYMPLLEEETEKTWLDLLNMVYVAFTRAEDKLFVFSKSLKKYPEKTTPGLLQGFLAKEGFWEANRNSYSFGAFDQVSREGSTTATSGKYFRKMHSRPWSEALRMKSHQAERTTAIGREEYLERGNLLHRAMEKINSPDDICPVLEQMLIDGEMDRTKKIEWEEKIRQLISHEEIAACFSAGATIKSEAGIFDSRGNYYRPDRVVLLPEKAVVIDYKTGKAYRKHEEQMETYARLLNDMGFPVVKKVLLYLDENSVKIV